jgi:hypothetical protein
VFFVRVRVRCLTFDFDILISLSASSLALYYPHHTHINLKNEMLNALINTSCARLRWSHYDERLYLILWRADGGWFAFCDLEESLSRSFIHFRSRGARACTLGWYIL